MNKDSKNKISSPSSICLITVKTGGNIHKNQFAIDANSANDLAEIERTITSTADNHEYFFVPHFVAEKRVPIKIPKNEKITWLLTEIRINGSERLPLKLSVMIG
ncbi:hypothetical protein J27TS8_18380 [Robertmurraya siralis]|uniref:Uncharacterized protein n=1 Tax=Robertmurraya siralis TaxID=77777 RepID=A0A919WH11_9BACI|nr:hypothetical protein J27TS8_18380 [Robertmurraya siralis]